MTALFNTPLGMTIDTQDNLFVADWMNLVIRKVTPQGLVTTYAGGTRGFRDGDRSIAQFDSPNDITLGPSGELYVSDWSNGAIRKIDAKGTVSPSPSSAIYSQSLMLTQSTFIRAQLYLGDLAVSQILERSFHADTPMDRFNQWRAQIFGADFETNPNAAPTADPDGDGVTNFQEYGAGTDPLNAASAPDQPLEITTFAGSTYGTNDGYRTDAKFNLIPDIKFDRNGNPWEPMRSSIFRWGLPLTPTTTSTSLIGLMFGCGK